MYYRKRFFNDIKIEKKGTLVFIPHSIESIQPIIKNLDLYIQKLKNLSIQFKPIVLCISHHDIQKKFHKELRKYNLPIVTVGNSNKHEFVDSFYSLILNFKYATSPNIGSQTYYALEAGLPYFLMGDEISYEIIPGKSYSETDLSRINNPEQTKEYLDFKNDLYNVYEEVTPYQQSVAFKFLGLQSDVDRVQGTLLIWKTFLFSMDIFFAYVFNQFIFQFKKLPYLMK